MGEVDRSLIFFKALLWFDVASFIGSDSNVIRGSKLFVKLPCL